MRTQIDKNKPKIPRLSLIIWSILLYLFAIIYGFIESNGKFAEMTLANFFSVNWRRGLTAIQTIWDVQVFWGELWFNLFIAILMAGIWIHKVPPERKNLWKGDREKIKKTFLISGVICFMFLIAMAISLGLSDIPPINLIENWYPTHMAYQLPTFPALIASMLLLVAPMKKYWASRKEDLENLEDNNVENSTNSIRKPRTLSLVLLIGAFILWLIMCIPTLWHPHALVNYEVQLFTWICTMSFPMIFFVFSATFMLKNPPERGDGIKSKVYKEFLLLIAALLIFVGLMLFAAFYLPQIGAESMGSIWIHWWWPIAHMPGYIFTASLAICIVSGFKLWHESEFQFKAITMKIRITQIQKKVITTALIAIMVAVPIFGIVQYASESDPPLVLVNMLGYMPESSKRVLWQAPNSTLEIPDTGSFSVYDSDDNSVVYTGNMEKFGTRPYYQHWYMNGTFTDVTAPGNYYITVTIAGTDYKSRTFPIGSDVYNITLERAVDFFYYQRDGHVDEIVEGYPGHEGHVNDALLFSGDELFDFNYPYNTPEHAIAGELIYKNLSGGWHDAGDYNKYNSWYQTQWFCTDALGSAWELSNESNYLSIDDKYDTSSPDILDEALWGANFLVRLTDTEGIHSWSKGFIIENVEGWNWKENKSALMSYTGPPENDWQRVGGSNRNEGYDYSSSNALPWGWSGISTAMGYAASLLKVARLVDDYQSDNPDWTYPAWSVNTSVLRETAFLINDTYDGRFTYGSHSGVFINHLMFLEEAAKISGDWTAADNWAANNMTSNMWTSGWMSAYMLAKTLSYYIENDRPIPVNVQNFATSFYNTVYPNYYHGPFKVLNTIITEEPRLFGRSYLNGKWDHHGLHNTDMFSYMYLLSIIEEAIPGTADMDLFQNELDFLFGVNPLALCQMDAVSDYEDFVPQIHHRYSYAYNPSGRVPGGIINGIRNVKPTKDWAIYNGIYDWAESNNFDDTIMENIMNFRWNMTGVPEEAWVDTWPANPLVKDGVDSNTQEIWIPHNALYLYMMSSFMEYHV